MTTALDASSSLGVDSGTHLWDLAHLARALSAARDLNVPIARSGAVPGVGDVLYWNQATAHKLFTALAHDRQAPAIALRG